MYPTRSHLNYQNVAFDLDLDNNIYIEDVNKFTCMQPETITLMQWIVYNAHGTYCIYCKCLNAQLLILW